MKVYTYYEPLGLNDAGSLVPIWREAWKRAGFEPVVLSGADRFHDGNMAEHARFEGQVKSYPTVNRPDYELACYLRWFALATRMARTDGDAAGGLMVDLDVLPVRLTPAHVGVGEIVFYDETFVPCAVWVSSAGLQALLGLLAQGPVVIDVGGRPHCSDLTILRQRAPGLAEARGGCLEYEGGARDDLRYSDALMLHFCYSRVGQRKAAAIRRFLAGG